MADFDVQNSYDKVAQIIAGKLKIDVSLVKPTATLQDLGADSLALVEIIMKLEEQFGIEIDDEQAEKLKNVQEVVDYVHRARSK